MSGEAVRAISLSCVVLSALVGSATAAGGDPGATIDVGKELWIRDLSVVEDPVRTRWVAHPENPSQGAWSFGRLMSHMSGLEDPAPFVRELFEHFRTAQNVNGFEVGAHTFLLQQAIDPWIAASHAHGLELDFSIAPFRLNGFVNRIDLRSMDPSGRFQHAGEGRAVFSVLKPNGSVTAFTLILEYELVASTCGEVKAWAEAWHALGSLPFGKDYNQALEEVVNRYAGPGVAAGRPNGSALRQLRTNELFFRRPGSSGQLDDFWQWREFHLSPTTGRLVQTTMAQTMDTGLNRTALLADYVNEHEAEILSGRFIIPLRHQGQPFRAGASNGEPLSAFFRANGIRNNDARHIVSLNTCVACHSEETGTDFFHSRPREQGVETQLSGFLTGISIPDPVDPTVTRTFDDFARRVTDLEGVLASSCEELARQRPLGRVH